MRSLVSLSTVCSPCKSIESLVNEFEGSYPISLLDRLLGDFPAVDRSLSIGQVPNPQVLFHHSSPFLESRFFVQVLLVSLACFQHLFGFKSDCVSHFLGSSGFESQSANLVLEELALADFLLQVDSALVDFVAV